MITSCEFHPYSTIFERYIEFGDSSVKIDIFGNFNGLKPCQDAYFRTGVNTKVVDIDKIYLNMRYGIDPSTQI